jgi:uncharacterized RmlC-like cupin family protein
VIVGTSDNCSDVSRAQLGGSARPVKYASSDALTVGWASLHRECGAMDIPASSAVSRRYRIVRPPERQDRSGQGLVRGFGVSQSTTGSTHLSMAHGVVPIGATSTRHYHPFEAAVFIISGKARSYFGARDEEWVDVEAGDFLYIPADLPHRTENIGDGSVEYVLARAAPEDVVIAVE